MSDEQPGKWNRLPKMNFSAKDLQKRMKRVEGATVRHARRFVFRRIDNIREVRRHIAIWVLMVGYIIAATALQLNWYQQGYRTLATAPDGTYAEGVLGPVNSLNPLFASSSAEQSLSNLVFSRLMNYDATGHLNYDLAERVAVNKSQKTYTVTLRDDVQWQDGHQLTARDVAFTLNLIKDPATRATISGWTGITVKVVNDTTISFTLPSVYAAFPHALTFPVLPEHLLSNVDPASLRETNFSNKPVGSGPFSFRLLQTTNESGTRKVVHLQRNSNYYEGKPKLERVQLYVYDTQKAITDALASSEVNAAVDISVSSLSTIESRRYSIERKPVGAGVYAFLNTTTPILKDKAVRQALQKGTNIEAVRTILGEDTPRLSLPFVAGQLTGNVPEAPSYNLAAAKKQLDKAGWRLKDGQTVREKSGRQLTLSVVTIKDSDFEKVLEKLISEWRQLGVGVATTIVDPSDPNTNLVQSILQPRQYDVLIYQLAIGADPDVYAYWHSSQTQSNEHGFNLSNYSNELSDDALLSARSRLEPALRNAKYITFAKQWLADVPAIGLYQTTAQYVSNRTITTLPTSSSLVSATDRYSGIIHWSVNERTVFTTP